MKQNCIIACIFREGNLFKECIKTEYGLLLLSHNCQVVWANMMGGECFIITVSDSHTMIYIYIYIMYLYKIYLYI